MGKDFYLTYKEVEKFFRKHPKLYPVIEEEIHRAIVSKYPYAVFYSVNDVEQIVDILAVIHSKRNPKYIRKRLKLR
ncbi:MAG: hypothetical protein AAF518_27015 [Spirochaetota bacterium]